MICCRTVSMGDEYDRDRMAALSAIYLEPEGSNQVLVVGPRSDDNARFGAYLKTLVTDRRLQGGGRRADGPVGRVPAG